MLGLSGSVRRPFLWDTADAAGTPRSCIVPTLGSQVWGRDPLLPGPGGTSVAETPLLPALTLPSVRRGFSGSVATGPLCGQPSGGSRDSCSVMWSWEAARTACFSRTVVPPSMWVAHPTPTSASVSEGDSDQQQLHVRHIWGRCVTTR